MKKEDQNSIENLHIKSLEVKIAYLNDQVAPLNRKLKEYKKELKELTKPVYKEVIVFGEDDSCPKFLKDWLMVKEWWDSDWSDWENVHECIIGGDYKETKDGDYLIKEFVWKEDAFIVELGSSSYIKDSIICDPDFGKITLNIL